MFSNIVSKFYSLLIPSNVLTFDAAWRIVKSGIHDSGADLESVLIGWIIDLERVNLEDRSKEDLISMCVDRLFEPYTLHNHAPRGLFRYVYDYHIVEDLDLKTVEDFREWFEDIQQISRAFNTPTKFVILR